MVAAIVPTTVIPNRIDVRQADGLKIKKSKLVQCEDL